MEKTVHQGWTKEGAGERYSKRRWRSTRAENRDPRLVSRLIRDHASLPAGALCLDAPSGTGRLRTTLEESRLSYFGAEISGDMLRSTDEARCVRADVNQLPFRDDTFDLVVCCRLLHHLQDPAARRTLLAELVRVSSNLVVLSFWDAGSWHALRRRRGWRRPRHADHRTPITRLELEGHLDAVGARVLGYRHSLRFVSPQAFAAARKIT